VIEEGAMKLRFWRRREATSATPADAAAHARADLAAIRRQTQSLAEHEGSKSTFEEQFRTGPGQYGGGLGSI
jgi:hypothetical protein